eukprot:CAMPEP_0184314160 /NCGR_PEP_ID=MMETSP1049-20130417/71759_1 /TAXON_ID=77928 /ORGANISM="Proteomonas sulcata, Strain CCMP704" /LENGTH=117 /DNA_ID=CAMNT_0026631937 /DNA_START=39 /DNA_END=392 /DNA_ORIENTATION=+
MWFGSLYGTFLTGVTGAALRGKKLPEIVAVPLVLGGFGLINLADMAYGTKLTRVVKEAEHIMEHERYRFIPPKQAPFHKVYTEAERKPHASVGAVGTYWPSFLPMARPSAPEAPKDN